MRTRWDLLQRWGLIDTLCVANQYLQVQKKRALRSARFSYDVGDLNRLHHIFDHLLRIAKHHHGLVEVEQLVVEASIP